MWTWITALSLASAPSLAGPNPALEADLQTLQAQRWQDSLDSTEYAASPYQSAADLPPVLEVETAFQAFNDYYYFALVDGRLYYKPRFKRPAGEPDWVTDLPWKLLGHGGGLPYRLDHRKAEQLDTTWADGDRNGFVHDRAFETATPDQWRDYIDVAGWEAASAWSDEPIALDPEFPSAERLIAITADADEIAVLTSDRRMFYRRKFANIFVSAEWQAGWGQSKDLPVYFPEHLSDHLGWSLGRITAAGVGYKEGPDGRIFEWGPAAVSMETMVWLSPDGRKIYYLDSGTPPEVVHFVEAPFRGQWRGEAINSAASTVMLIDRFGAVQTKIADFDLLGSTPTHPYCYNQECDDEPFYAPGDIRSGMADIRLPPEGWMVHSPVLPPEQWDEQNFLTRRISILQTGKGNASRELRIVGMKEGEVGTWYKALTDTVWSFRAAAPGDLGFAFTDEDRLSPSELAQYSADADLQALHAAEPSLDQELVGKLALREGVVLDFVIDDFNLEASPWQAHIRWREVDLPLQVHVVQAWNPYMAPHSGPGRPEIHSYEATLSFDRADLERRMAGGEASSVEGLMIRSLLEELENDKFALVINASERGFEVLPKSKRRMGKGFAVALQPTLRPESEAVSDWFTAFWNTQAGHMGWTAELAALSAQPQCGQGWAAQVVELDQRITTERKELNQVWREARRFSRFTFTTSGLMYVTQAKTLDAALDNRREWRGTEVRPNELRFNVITGVTSRIPYLAANIARVQRARAQAAASEAEALQPELDALVEIAEACD
ncbi:MAG: hypothetical protein VX899_25370 [Myxococcota bacterium]|nr:hypothetical protein [Myxococcota bacterium]